MLALKTTGILAVLISLSACQTTSPFSQKDLDKAKQQSSLIGLDISPQLRTSPKGPNPNPPRSKNTPAKVGNAAWNTDRDAARACVVQYDQLLGETEIIITEIKKMTSPISDENPDEE